MASLVDLHAKLEVMAGKTTSVLLSGGGGVDSVQRKGKNLF